MATKFTRPKLTADGFVGWVTFDQLRNADPCPDVGGVLAAAKGSRIQMTREEFTGWLAGIDGQPNE
jgi:hypothetical protein